MPLFLLLPLLLILTVKTQFITENRDYYQSLTWNTIKSTLNFGEVQGYYSISQLETLLNAYLANFPEIFAQIVVIGQTVQNRDILAIQMTAKLSRRQLSKSEPRVLGLSSFTNQFESRKAILFTGMHDGNDPLSMKMCIYILKRLVYGFVNNDQEIVYLLNNRQVWFIPMINADRYMASIVNNTLVDSYAKNMKADSNGCQGVSLRLNYPLYNGQLTWANSYACNSDYYGTGYLFTEPETKAVVGLIKKVSFGIVVNFFTENNAVLLPLSYSSEANFQDDSLYNKSGDYKVFRQFFDNGNLNAGTYFGTTFKRNGQVFYGEVSDYLYSQLGIYALSVELGKYGIPRSNLDVTNSQTIEILDYWYPMVLYSLYKIRENFYWETLYQLSEYCYDKHRPFLPCSQDNTTRVFSAKYVINNDGLADTAQLQVILNTPPSLDISAVSVQMTYSELYAFRDKHIILTQIFSNSQHRYFNIPTILGRNYRIITLYGTMEKEAEPISFSLEVSGYRSYEAKQNLYTTTKSVGDVKGFSRSVYDEIVDFEPRRPSIILTILYFVMMGMGLFGLACYYIFTKCAKVCKKKQQPGAMFMA
jgi:Zinc carboxypeptidase